MASTVVPDLPPSRVASYLITEERDGPARLLIERRGPDEWAVCDGRQVLVFLNGRPRWEFEPSPSHRTKQFLARSRFTLKGAIDVCNELELWDARWDGGWIGGHRL